MIDKVYKILKEIALNLGAPDWLFNLFIMGIVAGILLTFILITDMVLIYMERKISARFQARLGPMRVAWPKNFHGWAQPIADAIKLLTKEDIMPKKADKWVFITAPLVVIIPAIMIYVAIPFGRGWIVSDLNIGILYILSISSLTVIAIIMAGWGSNNKYALFSALRSAAQMISYEIPLMFSILSVVMLTGSLSMQDIVSAQKNIWFILLQPLGFLIYFICALAELNRVPFDIPEAESELVAGFHIEYSGMKFAFFFLAEYANMFAVSAICVTLFLGGWQGPYLPSFIWFLIKCYVMIIIMMWLRWTLPRLRVDQLMEFSWKILLPLSLLNLVITAIIYNII